MLADMNNDLRILGGLGILGSLGIVGLALLLSFVYPIVGEDFIEFLLLLSPLLLAPLMLALRPLLEQFAPRVGRLVTLLGLGGIIVFLVTLFVPLLVNGILGFNGTAYTRITGVVALGAILLVGLWLVLSGVILLGKGHIPAFVQVLGIIAGISWMIMVGSTIMGLLDPLMAGQFTTFLGANVVIWALSYALWALALSYWLFRNRDPVAA